MSAYTDIQVEVKDPVAIIRLNRPEKLNALTYHTLAEFRQAVDELSANPAVVGIVITGNGRGFCSGLDSLTLAETTADGGRSRRTSTQAEGAEVPGLFTYLLAVPKPVIAAVNGVAAGGGLVLATMCDVRIASTAASFTTVFLKRGLVAEHGTSWNLPRMLGPGRALDLLWTSRRVEAAEAYRIGLVEYLCEPEELLDRARDYVRQVAANAAPMTVADTKRLVYRHMGVGYPEALREADTVQWEAVARPDAREGAQALLEKREPHFQRLGGA
jgi:enoyl-CoA hydratase/carnithine racemase